MSHFATYLSEEFFPYSPCKVPLETLTLNFEPKLEHFMKMVLNFPQDNTNIHYEQLK